MYSNLIYIFLIKIEEEKKREKKREKKNKKLTSEIYFQYIETHNATPNTIASVLQRLVSDSLTF